MKSCYCFYMATVFFLGVAVAGCQKAPASSGEGKMSQQEKDNFGGARDATPAERAEHFREMQEAYQAKHPNQSLSGQGGPAPGTRAPAPNSK